MMIMSPAFIVTPSYIDVLTDAATLVDDRKAAQQLIDRLRNQLRLSRQLAAVSGIAGEKRTANDNAVTRCPCRRSG